MKYIPIGLDVRDRICIVVGGGSVGARKVRNLLRAGALVRVIAPEAEEGIQDLDARGDIQWDRRAVTHADLDPAFLVVVATDDPTINDRIVAEARRRGLLFCDASDAGRTQVIFGALHETPEVTVAVFTDGRDPRKARKTRDGIAELEDSWRKDQ